MSNENLQSWIKAFFEGSWLVPGWNSRVATLLAARPVIERQALQERLDRLGHRIAPEWARENDVRRIDNSDLAGWGRTLEQAQLMPAADLDRAIGEIEAEVEQRLRG